MQTQATKGNYTNLGQAIQPSSEDRHLNYPGFLFLQSTRCEALGGGNKGTGARDQREDFRTPLVTGCLSFRNGGNYRRLHWLFIEKND